MRAHTGPEGARESSRLVPGRKYQVQPLVSGRRCRVGSRPEPLNQTTRNTIASQIRISRDRPQRKAHSSDATTAHTAIEFEGQGGGQRYPKEQVPHFSPYNSNLKLRRARKAGGEIRGKKQQEILLPRAHDETDPWPARRDDPTFVL